MYIGNLMLLALNLPLIGFWVRLLRVPYRYLAIVVVTLCITGAYSIRNTAFDVAAMIVFGVPGYLIRKGGFPVAPMVLAMLLGRSWNGPSSGPYRFPRPTSGSSSRSLSPPPCCVSPPGADGPGRGGCGADVGRLGKENLGGPRRVFWPCPSPQSGPAAKRLISRL